MTTLVQFPGLNREPTAFDPADVKFIEAAGETQGGVRTRVFLNGGLEVVVIAEPADVIGTVNAHRTGVTAKPTRFVGFNDNNGEQVAFDPDTVTGVSRNTLGSGGVCVDTLVGGKVTTYTLEGKPSDVIARIVAYRS